MKRANKRLQPTRSASVASLPPLRVRLNRRPFGLIRKEKKMAIRKSLQEEMVVAGSREEWLSKCG